MLSHRFPTWARTVAAIVAVLACCATLVGLLAAVTDLAETDEFLDGLGAWLGLAVIAVCTPCVMVSAFVWFEAPLRAAAGVGSTWCAMSAAVAVAFSTGDHADVATFWGVTVVTLVAAAVTGGALAALRLRHRTSASTAAPMSASR